MSRLLQLPPRACIIRVHPPEFGTAPFPPTSGGGAGTGLVRGLVSMASLLAKSIIVWCRMVRPSPPPRREGCPPASPSGPVAPRDRETRASGGGRISALLPCAHRAPPISTDPVLLVDSFPLGSAAPSLLLHAPPWSSPRGPVRDPLFANPGRICHFLCTARVQSPEVCERRGSLGPRPPAAMQASSTALSSPHPASSLQEEQVRAP